MLHLYFLTVMPSRTEKQPNKTKQPQQKDTCRIEYRHCPNDVAGALKLTSGAKTTGCYSVLQISKIELSPGSWELSGESDLLPQPVIILSATIAKRFSLSFTCYYSFSCKKKGTATLTFDSACQKNISQLLLPNV